MPYFYLVSAVIFAASESIMGAFYNQKNEGVKESSSLYSFLCMCSVFLFWGILFCADFTVDWGVVWYALAFAFFYTLCSVCLIRALKIGPITLTSLFMQLSLVGTTIWGFLFWNADFTPLIAIGLILVVVAIWLCLYQGKSQQETKKVGVKWLTYAFLAFVANAGCSITQRTQQIRFDGKYGSFLMLLATGISVVFCLIAYLKSGCTDTKTILKKSWYIPLAAGGMNGLLNLFVILLATAVLSPSLIYPVIGVGSLVVTTFFSMLIFKEKMHWWQWCGVAIGAIAVALLSI